MRRLAGAAVCAVALALSAAAAAHSPADPLAPQQWYLGATRMFEAWPSAPVLAPVKVAVIDSGLDRTHPEFRGRIAAARSFVGGTVDDTQGHGTIVAGLIAAGTDDGNGIAGAAPSATLVVAKVVRADGTVPIEAEARAIRWAVDAGARVVNISLGGVRDPRNADRDTYSELEAEAVAYAVAKGVLVVAAVGNADQADAVTWPYANYPAALPHVLGVGALTPRGNVPQFSHRDEVHVDLVAPGVDMLSTYPLVGAPLEPDCADQGYTLCAAGEFRHPEGTSFAAPLVSAAAANLLGVRPRLDPSQVQELLRATAVDLDPESGCRKCSPGHDRLSGAGSLDAAAAVERLAAGAPPRDRFEPNDGGGSGAYRLYGGNRTVRATLHRYDDQRDTYAVYLRRGQLLQATTRADTPVPPIALRDPEGERPAEVGVSAGNGASGLEWRAVRPGWHVLELAAPEAPDAVAYTLVVRRS